MSHTRYFKRVPFNMHLILISWFFLIPTNILVVPLHFFYVFFLNMTCDMTWVNDLMI